jgi:hypothetical protein
MRVVPVTANVSFDSHLVVSRVVVTAIMSLATPGRMTVAPRTIAFIDITDDYERSLGWFFGRDT